MAYKAGLKDQEVDQVAGAWPGINCKLGRKTPHGHAAAKNGQNGSKGADISWGIGMCTSQLWVKILTGVEFS